ncbi:MAG: hypothetical protein OSJ71_06380 [Acetatifactor sp.]|nr:hypothetical protein [Acetatifactor sp.]
MTELYYCKVSKINYAAGTASLTIEDQENQVITGVPFLASEYNMPAIGDMVAAIFNKSGGKIERGVILGKIFSRSNKPGKSGAGVFYKALPDGAYVYYDPAARTLDITVDKIIARKIVAKEITTDQS